MQNYLRAGLVAPWNNSAAIAYGIKGIPLNVLLDKDGVIIAKNLRGANLENKLKEIFKE